MEFLYRLDSPHLIVPSPSVHLLCTGRIFLHEDDFPVETTIRCLLRLTPLFYFPHSYLGVVIVTVFPFSISFIRATWQTFGNLEVSCDLPVSPKTQVYYYSSSMIQFGVSSKNLELDCICDYWCGLWLQYLRLVQRDFRPGVVGLGFVTSCLYS